MIEIELRTGRRKRVKDALAKVLIRKGVAKLVEPEAKEVHTPDLSYQTRAIEAPYGYKADGTPRKRPGRQKAEE